MDKRKLGYGAIEYWGDGDPMFGGQADDRVLTVRGQFERAPLRQDRAIFDTFEAAQAAADEAPHRPGGLVSVVDMWG